MHFHSHLLLHSYILIIWWQPISARTCHKVTAYSRLDGDKNKDLRSPCSGVWPPEDGSSKFLQNVGRFLPATWCHIPEDGILRSHNHENQKSHECWKSHSLYSLCHLLLLDYRRINMEATSHAPLHTRDARWVGRRWGKGTSEGESV